ncbi:hypothetical protein M430DRAFT_64160 [Amorphotheca resinae ATCC 22711]|uniref:Coupling of ubiquitin conjugation to ER degradation protein 1 n=1 Tax=Amorphotheca resinae ATCC 22711 TaxID=857342 RepID=A0A2T3BBD8_AMORE|nr:hypothetical protein M430DRAFT_64160 [Amorphotheca resinae ATCC 22711]PSS25631.1 hypothetical protein M430DRAFT_64160 [Amorphotheca resinae ATCC 22711]
MPSSTDQTINIPQLLIVLLLGGLAIRYFFFSSSPGSDIAADRSSAARRLRAREADVERVQQMFPQIPRRTIMWDLQRNGGNVVATTERILSGRGLEVPPQTFQPPAAAPASTSTSATATGTQQQKPLQPDLITRYNLQDKLAAEESSRVRESSAEGSTAGARQAWSQNKNERQALLQRRREEMILAARRKMEARVAAEAAAAAAAAEAQEQTGGA